MTNNKHIIMKALCLTELQYGEMVQDAAHRWMARYFGTEAMIIDALNHSKSFWKWWVNQWDNRDHEFIAEYKCLLELTTWELTKWLYEEHHDPDRLRIIPNDMVVREVGKLIKVEESKIKGLKSNG